MISPASTSPGVWSAPRDFQLIRKRSGRGRRLHMTQLMTASPNGTAPTAQPWLEVLGSRYFAGWLAEQNVSLALTTYQAGKLFLIGRQTGGRISVFKPPLFNRCMGLWADGATIWMSSLYQLWRLENGLKPGHLHNGHDALYIPRRSATPRATSICTTWPSNGMVASCSSQRLSTAWPRSATVPVSAIVAAALCEQNRPPGPLPSQRPGAD